MLGGNFSLAVPSSFHLDVIMTELGLLMINLTNRIITLGVWGLAPDMKNKIYKQIWQTKQ